MCGIVGGITYRDIGRILLQGLKRLEYRGYDSAGIAIISHQKELYSKKVMGKVNDLLDSFLKEPIEGNCGLAHTRWATHGEPSRINAHPHISCNEVAIVHNGIVENHVELRSELIKKGYHFSSQTDSETLAHLIHSLLKETKDLLSAVQLAVKLVKGMYAIGVICNQEPDCLIVARSGSPLVIGMGKNENFVASDSLALLPFTNEFTYLEEGDVAKVTKNKIDFYDKNNNQVERKAVTLHLSGDLLDRGNFQHYMEKEIFEQPMSSADILEGRITKYKIWDETFGVDAAKILSKVEQVMIVACGTSYHAALVARYWLEEIAGVSCQVDISSEYRYRHAVIRPNTLFVVLSQSGETADTLSSFRLAKTQPYLSALAICNVPHSSLVRESELVFLTHAGPEIGVASTKSFTSQLIALLMLTVVLGRNRKLQHKEKKIIELLFHLPELIEQTLLLKDQIYLLARKLLHKEHALFLGRGSLYPIAMEGALKLKEITYIHAEAYPAGELKHGPLAMVDKNMPIIVVAPDNDLFEKLRSNLQEVKARGGDLLIFAHRDTHLEKELGAKVIKMPDIDWILAPMIYTIPLQLLAYYVGIIKGTDVDQPRNLAKSVTVE